LWKFEDAKISNGANANIWGGLGAGTQRLADNQNTTLSWNFVKQQPSTYTCANVNVKAFSTPTPPPTVPPTVPPTQPPTAPPTVPPTSALPTVDLKMNGADLYFFDSSLQTLLAQKYTLSWKSTNATGCTINYGDWLGAATKQPTSGTISLGTGSTSSVWQLSCTGPLGTATDVTRVLVTRGTKTAIPLVGLFANNVDTAPYKGDNGVVRSLVIKSGTAVTLSWSAAGSASCVASGSWTGAKAVNGGSQAMGAITAAKTYILTCTTGTYTATTSVKITVK
jgi:hypothetical protein